MIVSPVSAQTGHLTLLTVTEGVETPHGGTADLYLHIQPGTGQVFMDTFPLAKLDTQSSTRYATRVACSYAGVDCEQYDFFFTIRANSRIVGGPSAGAAIAVLTAALLTGTPVDDSIAITGTIDSGGLIGPVAGIKEKVLAAQEAGLSLVLISAFAYPTELNKSYLVLINHTNESVNLSRVYVPFNVSSLGIPVRRVTTLADAIAIFAGREPEPAAVELHVDDAYQETMRAVAEELCQHRDELKTLSRNASAAGQNTSHDTNRGDTNQEDSRDDPLGLAAARESARAAGDWYSLASYCFREAIVYRERQFSQLSPAQLEQHRRALRTALKRFRTQLRFRSPRTMAQLETAMIVAERLDEAEERLANLSATNLAFAQERLNSARAWFAFWSMRSPHISLDERHLRRACTAKLTEAQERISYIGLYLPEQYLVRANEEIRKARAASDEGDPARCVYYAAKARAQANVLGSTLATPEEQFPLMLAAKLRSAARVINEQEHFPILGYSYYRYAQSLGPYDRYSALVFAEYALELADLSVYFPRARRVRVPWRLAGPILLFFGGVLVGVAIFSLVQRHPRGRSRRRKPSVRNRVVRGAQRRKPRKKA